MEDVSRTPTGGHRPGEDDPIGPGAVVVMTTLALACAAVVDLARA